MNNVEGQIMSIRASIVASVLIVSISAIICCWILRPRPVRYELSRPSQGYASVFDRQTGDVYWATSGAVDRMTATGLVRTEAARSAAK